MSFGRRAEWVIDRIGGRTMFYLTCSMIPSVGVHDIWSKTISSTRHFVEYDNTSMRHIVEYDNSSTTTIRPV